MDTSNENKKVLEENAPASTNDNSGNVAGHNDNAKRESDNASLNRYTQNAETFEKLMVDRLMATKKVKANRNEVAERVSIVMQIIDVFNSLSWSATMLHDIPISKWAIPDEFAGLIYPASVRVVAGNLKHKDLVFRPNVSSDVNYESYVNACAFIRSLAKRGCDDGMTNIEAVRTHVSLNDVLSKVANSKNSVNYEGEPYFPIQLANPGILDSFFEPYVFNCDAARLIGDYIESKVK